MNVEKDHQNDLTLSRFPFNQKFRKSRNSKLLTVGKYPAKVLSLSALTSMRAVFKLLTTKNCYDYDYT